MEEEKKSFLWNDFQTTLAGLRAAELCRRHGISDATF
jgi:hypothetical protein